MKKIFSAVTLSAALLLSACGSSSDSTTSSSSGGAEKIIIGTGSEFINICFYDENGNLTGYDIELLKEIDNRLEEYEFDFQTMSFDNLLLSLESGKIDVVAHNMAKNPEREEKFLFNKQPYNAMPTQIVVHEDNNEIQSLDDLEGKKVGLQPTSHSSLFFENYIKENNSNAEPVYVSSTQDYFNQLKTGRIDAIFLFPFAVEIYNRESDAQLKIVGEPIMYTDIHFLLNKNNPELSDAIDGALKELIEDGTVKDLSTKWLGADYSVEL